MNFLRHRQFDDEEKEERLNCSQGLRKAWILFKKTHSKRQRSQKDKFLQKVLQTRAWILHSIFVVARIAMWYTGKA